jgi:hypothetical protein
MDIPTKTTVRRLKTPSTLALLLGLTLSACAVARGSFAPTAANHPANPDAEEGDIQDPGKSLAMSGDHSAASEHSESHGAGKPEQARYVCPMHPDVVSDQPGKCPRCGMALKESKPEAPEEHVHDH